MKKASSLTLYVMALILILVTEIYLAIIFKTFILSGDGIGVYGMYMYLSALLVSTVLWGVSFKTYKNRAMAITYWIVALALMPIVIFQPIWWAAPY